MLIGLDVGTSGCKAVIADDEGAVMAQSYREYPTLSIKPGWQEIDPELMFRSVKAVLAEAMLNCRGSKIAAISVSSFGESFIAVGKNGGALHNCMLYTDVRGTGEAAELGGRAALEQAVFSAGAPMHPMYSLPKLMWLKNNKPDIFHETWKCMLISGFILFKLGAKPHIDYSLAARTLAFDVVDKSWSGELLDAAGVDRNMMCEPVQSGTVVGEIDREIAQELGINTGALLVAGGHDQPCAALGAGAIKPGMAIDGMGTSECIAPAFDKPVLSDIMRQNGFACVPHVVPDMYITYAFTFACGAMLKWFRDSFGQEYLRAAAETGANVFEQMINSATGAADNLFVLPHFAGAATPYMDNNATGAIVGLSLTTGPRELLGAVLEGITFEIMTNARCLADSGISVTELRAVGGLAQSGKYLQMKANMMGMEIAAPDVSEAGALGASILAGTAAGVFASCHEGAERFVRIKRRYYPDMQAHGRYSEKFETYRRLYPAVKSIYRGC